MKVVERDVSLSLSLSPSYDDRNRTVEGEEQKIDRSGGSLLSLFRSLLSDSPPISLKAASA